MVALNSDLRGNGAAIGEHSALSPTVETEANPPVRLDTIIERFNMVELAVTLPRSADIDPVAGIVFPMQPPNQ